MRFRPPTRIAPDLALRQMPDRDPPPRRRHHPRHAPLHRTRPRTMPRPEMADQMKQHTHPNPTEETVTPYPARLEKEHDGRWSVELDEEPRVHTWGKTIDQALTRIRE